MLGEDMNNKSIYDTPEYALADSEKQRWAFTHRDNHLSAVDAAKRMGLKLDNLKATVKLNTGATMEVPFHAHFYSVVPDAQFKRVNRFENKKYEVVYMVKGSSPKLKSAVYFTNDDFVNSDDVKKVVSDIDNAAKEFGKQHRQMLKDELTKSHAPMAKKAAKELPALADQPDAEQKVYDWFVSNKFDMGSFKPSHFKPFVNKLKRDGHISAEFGISSRPDGYGHETGTSGKIDFANKRLGMYGWSSDD
jgi:hypothetical protein